MDLSDHKITIDEIVVHGTPVHGARGFEDDFARELQLLFEQRGLPGRLTGEGAREIEGLEARFSERPGASPGAATAQALYEELDS